eukprot:747635-Hanusia_phi.AAC.1
MINLTTGAAAQGKTNVRNVPPARQQQHKNIPSTLRHHARQTCQTSSYRARSCSSEVPARRRSDRGAVDDPRSWTPPHPLSSAAGGETETSTETSSCPSRACEQGIRGSLPQTLTHPPHPPLLHLSRPWYFPSSSRPREPSPAR